MVLEGSCHCGAVTFSLRSSTPYPYMACYCSICRKTAGGGGFAVNIMREAGTLEVRGRETVSVYRARRAPENGGSGDGLSSARRHFCALCESALWAFDPRWPELVHPFASAIDTPLPRASERVHCMAGSVAAWVEVPSGDGHSVFDKYPDDSIEDWHRARGLTAD